MSFYHKHLIVNAKVKNPITDEQKCVEWFKKLVDVIDMKILIAPMAKFCDTPGNEGITGTVVIETSHASIHIWSNVPEPYLRMDVYSCKDFNADDVLKYLDESMNVTESDTLVIDRNETKLKLM